MSLQLVDYLVPVLPVHTTANSKILTNIGIQTAVLRLDYFHQRRDKKQFDGVKDVVLKKILPASADRNFLPVVPGDFSPKLVDQILEKFEKHLSEFVSPTPVDGSNNNRK